MKITDILPETYVTKEGIYLPKQLNDSTVWDTLATNDLLDAATSATSEEHAIEKGTPQIDELEKDALPGIILDLGCGYARVAEQLLPRRTFDAYIGVDSSLRMLRFAQERKVGRKDISTPMHFVYGTIDALPIANDSIDTIIVSAVFLHNHKSVVHKSIDEVYRVLRPGGKLFVYGSFPNLFSLMGFQAATYLFFLQIFGDPYRNGPVRYYGKQEVAELLKSFSSVQIVPFGFSLLPKRILILPRPLNLWYMRFIANPVNRVLDAMLPSFIGRLFATHHDVIAIK